MKPTLMARGQVQAKPPVLHPPLPEAFGRALIGLGDDITWSDLKNASRTNKWLKKVKLELLDVDEIVRGTNAPIPFTELEIDHHT